MIINIIKPISNYGALHQHADNIAESLKLLGHKTRILDLSTNELEFESEKYFITFNLAAIDLSDHGRSLFGDLGFQLININVDHPIFSLPRVVGHGIEKNITHICIDKKHVDLYNSLSSFTGHKKNHFLPPGAKYQDFSPWNGRDKIVFTGGYPSPARSWGNDEFATIIDSVADLYLEDENKTVESCLKQVIIDTKSIVDEKQIFRLLFRCAPVYKFVQGTRRRALFDVIGNLGIPIYAYGDGWDQCTCKDINYIKKGSFAETLEIQRTAKLIINSNNGFTHGGHERVFAAQMSGCPVFSDWNQYYEDEFGSDSMIFYRFADLQEAAEIFADAANDSQRLEEIAANGYRITSTRHTWDERAKNLLQIIQNDTAY